MREDREKVRIIYWLYGARTDCEHWEHCEDCQQTNRALHRREGRIKLLPHEADHEYLCWLWMINKLKDVIQPVGGDQQSSHSGARLLVCVTDEF